MGVSFKISRTGTRFKPKPVISDSIALIEGPENSLETSRIPTKHESNGKDEDAVGPAGSSITSGTLNNCQEDEISFTLSLYRDGYSIGKPSENDSGLHAAFQEGSKLLHPYDRTSEDLFSAIESGRLPGGILDDIPCKFVDGTLICEVRDYRKCISGSGSSIPSVNGSAMITKVRLKMSLENVVKDIPSMADDSWTYGDLMEVESRILKALQPKLCLDPTPRLDRLCENPVSPKLNLGLVGKRKRRLKHMPEVTVTSNNRPHGKKICIDRAPESSSYGIGELGSSGDMITQHVQDNVAAQVIGSNNMLGPGNLRNMSNSAQGPTNVPGMARVGQDMPVSYAENMNSTAPGKMESQGGPYPTLTKRTRLEGVQQQQIGSYVDGLQGPDVQWRNQLVQQQPNARGIQYANPGMQKYPQLVSEGVANPDIKVEKPDSNLVKSDMQMMEAEGSHMDPRQRFQQNSFMRTAFQQANWTNLTQQVEKDPRREDQFHKRKSIQSPRPSAGAVAQSPLSAKSPEISCGSMGAQYGAVSSAAPFGQLQREKTAVTSIPAADRTTSLTSSANDSMQPQHQAQLTAKRRSNSLSKNPVMSGVGSPASVNNVGGPMNASSPSISTPQLTDQSMIDRFAKIEMVAMRHNLNRRKNKVDEYPRRPQSFSTQELLVRLSSTTNSEYVKDENCTRPLSQSLVGGSLNVCKIRVLTLRLERTVQGNMIPVSPTGITRMIMSEKPNDGIVAMHYGDLGDDEYLNAEDYLPTLPNTHMADLLAAQFCSLMFREGYMVEDHVQPRPSRLNIPSNSQTNAPGVAPNNATVDMQPYSESAGQQTNETKPTINNAPLNSSSNILPSSGMLSAGSSQALQVSQGLVSGVSMPPRLQQMDPQQTPQQQQQQQPQQQLPLQNQPSLMTQQQPQFPRSPLMLPNNSMPQLNSFGQGSSMPMGSHIGNKPSPLQLLQQQQPQQVPQMQRRMMMGLGPAMGMGTIGNNMVGLGALGNVMGIGGARGMGGTGISAPMGAISGMGANVAQNPMSISQHIRAGTLSPQQAQAAMVQKLRLLQSRGMLTGNQPGVSGITGGARQMQPGSTGLSMLGRGNINPMQRTPMGQMGQMGMPKLMSGMTVPMNQPHMQLQQQLQMQQQQQIQQQQMHMQQQQQQQQPQQQQMQQQEATSPLQAVVSPQQVGSPSTLGIPQSMNQQVTQQQQQASPQQIGQRTPMSPPLSSGPMHPMSAGNPEACPASPALSSQTLGSVGSITNSPMDLQGVNKSNSVTNT